MNEKALAQRDTFKTDCIFCHQHPQFLIVENGKTPMCIVCLKKHRPDVAKMLQEYLNLNTL